MAVAARAPSYRPPRYRTVALLKSRPDDMTVR
jgi:hypothetical protein